MKRKNNDLDFPLGRTFNTNDKYLPHNDKNAYKNVNIVSIEKDKNGNMLAVRLTTQKTKNTSSLNHHTYKGFKHFVEYEDIDGRPIRKNERFKQNSSNYDLSSRQVDYINDIVFNHSKQSQTNRQKRENFRQGKFRNKKK